MKVVLGHLKKVEAVSSLGKVIYANNDVKTACKDAKVQTKIESLLHTPGETRARHRQEHQAAKGHSHVTNKDGIAFNWQGSDLHIVGYGTKNNKAARRQLRIRLGDLTHPGPVGRSSRQR